MTDISGKEIGFQADDGWPLSGTLYRPTAPSMAILISAGTGFPRRFYKAIAQYLAGQGALVLTFDYRGVEDPTVKDLATSGIQYSDYARDQDGAVQALTSHAPGLPIFHIAHSVGGHFLGLMKHQALIQKHAFVSVGTGYMGGHFWSNRPLELFFWWGLGPYHLFRYGYIRSGGLWKGASLPPDVFKTWRRWCHKRHYFQDELGTRLAPHHYDAVRTPIRSWIFTDDPIATPRAGRDLLSVYGNVPEDMVVRAPSDFGVKRIGHEGAFRPGREALWAEILVWLQA